MIEQLGAHVGKRIVFGYDRHLLPEVDDYVAQLARYGMVVTDTAGAVVLMAEDAQPFLAAGLPNPYEALFAGTPSYSVLEGMPWSRLQVVPPDWESQPGS